MYALSAGVYNWDFVIGIETIVNWCRAHGVKIMFTFLDNWSTVDSKSAVRCFHRARTVVLGYLRASTTQRY